MAVSNLSPSSVSRGTAGRDVFRGTRGDDEFAGRGGNDVIRGRAGDDSLRGGGGSDVIRGGRGQDDLAGGRGTDRLFGGKQADTLSGGRGADELRGGGGNDVLLGGGGRDELTGGRGDDRLTGGAGGDDFVFASVDDGFDTITDFNLAEGDRIGLQALLGQAPAGSGPADLVRVTQSDDGAVLAVAPGGDGQFQDLTLLAGRTLSLQDLLDAGALPGLPGDDDPGGNGTPVARRDLASTSEDAAIDLGDLLTNDSDPDGDPLGIVAVDATRARGEVTLNPDGTVTYDPAGEFDNLAAGVEATDRFEYTLADGRGGSDTARVIVTVRGVNDAPEATVLADQTVREAGPPLSIDLADVFSDPDDGAVLTYEAARASGRGLPDWLTLEDGVLSGRPGPLDRMELTVRLAATDEHDASEETTFSLETELRAPPGQPRQSAPAANTDGSNDSLFPSASADGRFVAHLFLERGEDNAGPIEASIRIKDFATDTEWTIFAPETNRFISGPSLSADGTTVAFAWNRGGDDQVRVMQIAGTDPLAVETLFTQSVAASGDAGSFGFGIARAALSADGGFVAFEDGSSVVVAAVGGGDERLVIPDARAPALSGDGSQIVFEVPVGDFNGDIAHARIDTASLTLIGTPEIISLNAEGAPVGQSRAPDISDNGEKIAFASDAPNLVAGDTHEGSDVFVYDVGAGELSLASVDSDGDLANLTTFTSFDSPSLSADGATLAFSGPASDGSNQILIKDLGGAGGLRVASVTAGGQLGDNFSSNPALSADGTSVSFHSFATNLTPDAAENEGRAVFLTPVNAPFTSEVDYPAPAEPLPPGPDGFTGTIGIDPALLNPSVDSLIGTADLPQVQA